MFTEISVIPYTFFFNLHFFTYTKVIIKLHKKNKKEKKCKITFLFTDLF